MSQNEIEELKRQLEQLKIITSEIQSENRTLRERINRLELQAEPTYNVGDRIKILNPTYPGRNRKVIPQDSIGTVTRVAGDWVHFTCDSGVRTKRISRNIRRL